MESKTLFELVLSESSLNNKTCIKTAKIVNLTGVSKKSDFKNKYSIIRFEICVKFHKSVPIDVSMTDKDFHWFVESAKKRSEKSSHMGSRMLQFVNLGDNSFTLCSIDNSKCFGVQLETHELDKIIEYEKMFKIIMDNYNLSGDKLKNVSCELFVGVLGTYIIQKLYDNCQACRENSETLEHKCCNGLFCHRLDKKTLMEESIVERSFETKFATTFTRFMDLLNADGWERQDILQYTLNDLSKDTSRLGNKLAYFIDIKDQLSNDIMHVISLITNLS